MSGQLTDLRIPHILALDPSTSPKFVHNGAMPGPVRMIRYPAPPSVEPAIHELILTAIHQKRLLRFVYKEKIRVVEPQDYGIQKGAVHLFTYQLAGESSSGTLPDWRKFAVQGISNIELLEESFPGSRAVPSQRHQEWDVLFGRVDHS
jgi:hypothetical protein